MDLVAEGASARAPRTTIPPCASTERRHRNLPHEGERPRNACSVPWAKRIDRFDFANLIVQLLAVRSNCRAKKTKQKHSTSDVTNIQRIIGRAFQAAHYQVEAPSRELLHEHRETFAAACAAACWSRGMDLDQINFDTLAGQRTKKSLDSVTPIML